MSVLHLFDSDEQSSVVGIFIIIPVYRWRGEGTGRFKYHVQGQYLHGNRGKMWVHAFYPVSLLPHLADTPFFPFPSWVLQALAIIASQGHLCDGMLGLQNLATLTPTTSRVYVLILGVMAKPESILCVNRCTKYTHWDSGREKLHAIRHSHQCYCKIMCAHFDDFWCVARIWTSSGSSGSSRIFKI